MDSSERHGGDLLLARHGRTDWSGRRFTGQRDVPLNQDGLRQAAALGASLDALAPTLVVCSDLSRAFDTAREVARRLGATWYSDPRLREESLGPWEGRTADEMRRMRPAAVKRWEAGDPGPHDGREGLLMVARRAYPAVADAIRADRGRGTVVIVSHSNVVIALLGYLLQLPPARWLSIGSLEPGAWSRLRWGHDDRWILESHNHGV